LFILDHVSLVHVALGDMKLDETYHLPTPANSICLSAVELMLAETQVPSEKTKMFCNWLVSVLDQTINQSLSKKGIAKR